MRRGSIEHQVGYIEAEPCELPLTGTGRFNLPVCFRRGNAYHLISMGNCLVVFPERFYDELACEYTAELPPTDEKRKTHFSGVKVELDNYGRLVIPESLTARHRIPFPGRIELIASGDCFLIQPRSENH